MNNNLIEELLQYSKRLKAISVYRRCLRNGRLEWAQKIDKKYNVTSVKDDLVISLGYAMQSYLNKWGYVDER